ncbi:MAG: L,D-transpeptidase [Lachnospiraceae bacterium]|nr:L,D-transpeptidase [Lachnospiraceae bacterium]
MLEKIGKFFMRLFLSLMLVCVAIYLCIAYFYKDVFMLNTWINGVYCTGKTVEEVNSELLFQTEAPFLTIIGTNGETAELNMAYASYHADYTKALQSCMGTRNSLLWPLAWTKEQHIQIEPEKSWNDTILKQLITELELVKQELPEQAEVSIIKGENGYELVDGTRQVFHPEIFADYVLEKVRNGMYEASIAESGAYQDLEYTPRQLATLDLWHHLQDFLSCDIIYDMGAEQIALDRAITSQFILLDEQGEFVLDDAGRLLLREEGIVEFVEQLAAEYNTSDTELAFEATRGETVQIPYKNYGTKLDSEAEIAYLKEAFLKEVSEVHIPKYLEQGYVRGKNDIGDTYIEIDMTNQKLYGYKAGELIVETDIVTGNMRKGWDTPVGVNHVYSKQKNRILRGATYASHVDYWMPVNGNIGIHDADWRKKFGGEVYLKNGSHGCINIPPKVMPTIYEEYEVGTPVIMFY